MALVFFAAWMIPTRDAGLFGAKWMKTNTALCLMLLATSVILSGLDRRWATFIARLLALISIAVGIGTLLEYALGVDLGIDQLIATEPYNVESAPFFNRMAPNAGAGFVLAGATVLMVRSKRRRLATTAQALAVMTLAIGLLALIGYLYQTVSLYRPMPFVRLSQFTATGFVLLASALLALRDDFGVGGVLAGTGTASYLARRLLIAAIFVPVVYGWLVLELEHVQIIRTGAGITVLSVAFIATFAAVIFVLVRSIEAIDGELRANAKLIAALARSVTVDDVLHASVDVGLPALGAVTGGVFLADPADQVLRLHHWNGTEEVMLPQYLEISLDEPVPLTDAFRTRQPVFVSSVEDYQRRYPNGPSMRFETQSSWAILPLSGRGRLLGAMVLGFGAPRTFDGAERDRLTRIASQCGQALDRSLLYESERTAQLRAAVTAGSIGIWTYDPARDRVVADRLLAELYGIDPDRGTAGLPLAELLGAIHEDDRARVAEAMAETIERGEAFEAEYRVRDRSGEIRWISARGRVERAQDGTAVRFPGAVVDLTNEYRAREAAEAANRAKDEFLAMLGHELRNPLSPILTSLELMRLRDATALKKERDVITRQVHHLTRLVDDLLDVSRITRGKVELRKSVVEMSQIVNKAIEVVSPLLEERRHHLAVLVPRDGLQVDVDEHRVTQAVSNLLSNAAKYTDAGGHIEVSARLRAGDVVVTVKDDGIGIAPNLIPVVFDLFAQGERTIERSQGGLGLGLAIVKSLIEMHGGAVAANSAGLGRGSEFSFTLPCARGARVVSSPGAERLGVDIPGSRRRILVVDDNRDAAEMLAEILRARGHAVEVAFDGPSGLERAATFSPELVFLDLGLPVMDGFEVARRLRQMPFAADLKLVAITGYGQESHRAATAAAGFDHHLVKPVDPEVTLALAG